MTPAEIAVRLLHDIDRQDWDAIAVALAGTVRSDYTSLFEGEVEQVPAEDLIARWKGLLPGFDATQHVLGPLIPAASPPEPGSEWFECNVRAHHRIGNAEWLVAGRYVIRVTDGKVSAITLQTIYQDGDLTLPEQAARRAAAG